VERGQILSNFSFRSPLIDFFSTHDGTAIACAVLRELADRRSRCFFSTHYHNLVDQVKSSERISFGHMVSAEDVNSRPSIMLSLIQACMVENENDADPTMENVTFLYTLSEGVCPKSYGFYAAKVSGVKEEVSFLSIAVDNAC
jgi:DNA mismatch repair protein MSH6